MIAPRLETINPAIQLIEPNIDRDSSLSLHWLEGELGRNTLSLMGLADEDNKASTLEKEHERIRDFIEKEDQLNWMIQLDGKVVGSIWVDLKPTQEVLAPAIHIMVGDVDARGRGVGMASLKAVADYLMQQGEEVLYSRVLVKNKVAAKLLEETGFELSGESYVDADGLEWQNATLYLNR